MHSKFVVLIATTLFATLATSAGAMPPLGPWQTAHKVDEIAGNSSELNTESLDGCPIESPDGLDLYMASGRANPHGGLDIWVAHRRSINKPFGPPQNLPEPVNSASDDFCPTPLPGGRLLFVSRRGGDGTCGLGDIYFTRQTRHGWREPFHLACAPNGPNTALDEQGPSYVNVRGRAELYFSSGTPTVPGDLYVSTWTRGAGFGPGLPVAGLNSAANDIQPNVSSDGREIVFSSNRPDPAAHGAQDIYTATRRSAKDPWSAPVNVGGGVNTGAAETRPSLSWDGRRLYFGRMPGTEGTTGASDIFVSTRERDRRCHNHHR